MKNDILLIAHFCGDFNGTGNNRFNYLAEKFSSNNYSVEVVTSNFSHKGKTYKDKHDTSKIDFKVTYIDEPGYTKNVSLKRFYSHYIMARNLKKYLTNRKTPSLIYCAVPSLDVALVAAKYAKKNKVKLIIDVQDLWPEAFKMVLNLPLVYKPMEKMADYIYSSADDIIAVSETYMKRAVRVNNKIDVGHVIYLGTDLEKFDHNIKENKYKDKPDNEIWVCYVGTLGHSYDLTTAIDALELLKTDKKIKNVKFIVLGDGPLRSKFEEYSNLKKVDAVFTGRLPYAQMVGMLAVCDLAINPISRGAAQSIINKHGDYAAAGIPVLNTQESPEYRNLVDNYKMGINCINNDHVDLAEKMSILLNDEKLRIEMGKNSRRLAEEKFDRRTNYFKIVNVVETALLDSLTTSK